MPNNEIMRDILVAWLKDEITPEQEQILNKWLDDSSENRETFSRLTNDDFLVEELKIFDLFDAEKLQAISNQGPAEIGIGAKSVRRKWLSFAAAAAVLGLICLAFYLTERYDRKAPVIAAKKVSDVQAPIISKAFIKADNGRMILLDTIKANTVFSLNGADVIKNDSGQIIYRSNSGAPTNNTLFNPRGGNIITVVLSDGTKVWLNSESSITYPISFGDTARSVSVKGEAYFEVAKSATKKFIVTTDRGITTEVLGTHFNINSYDDEDNCIVTLIEGRVQVHNSEEKVLLMPAQQATQRSNGRSLLVRHVNVNKVIAWKEGTFNFDEENIYTISRQFQRWYNIDVNIKGDFSGETYSGIISKKLSLLQVMQVLKFAGLNYQISNNQLIITKI
ncbi:FecR family protein [Chitinophagaceae bacterium 26-R-25]|nr:FecR family protein [Chitinophagaceae bacterium 26-R-25]